MERLNLREQAGGHLPRRAGDRHSGSGRRRSAGIFRQGRFPHVFPFVSDRIHVLPGDRLGGLFFVLLQHATKAGWSVNVRRIAEWFAASSADDGGACRFRFWSRCSWAWLALSLGGRRIGASDKGFKGWWLQPRILRRPGRLLFRGLVVIGVWYWKQSIKQDETGDIALTLRMQYRAPLGTDISRLDADVHGVGLDHVARSGLVQHDLRRLLFRRMRAGDIFNV